MNVPAPLSKTTTYERTRFKSKTLRAAIAECVAVLAERGEPTDIKVADAEFELLIAYVDGARWQHNSLDEFYADMDRAASYYAYGAVGLIGLKIEVLGESTMRVTVQHTDRAVIERITRVFTDDEESSRLPARPKPPAPKPRIFIGHGGKSHQWMILQSYLRDQLGYDVVAFESGSRAGHEIRDILESMLADSNFALLVMSAEDEQEDGTLRARQNVVHETGLFQGRLGWGRAVVLLEKGVENYSNLSGVTYVSFEKDAIKNAHGEIAAVLKAAFD